MMSAKRPTLAVLTHSTDDFWRGHYLIRRMIPRWEAMGLHVVVVTDADPFVPADIALLHVAPSVVPDGCRRLAERYPVVLNGGVLDIRKRSFSRLLVDRQGPHLGSVIVKTDWNYGGFVEFRRRILESPIGPLLRRFYLEKYVCHTLALLEARRSWRRKRLLPPRGYPVYAERDMVPGGVWDNPNLIVQRFAAERDGSNYCCRHWLFFGHQEVSRRTLSPHPVVKAGAKIERITCPVPKELRTIREQLGFDFGKFDYGIVDGEVVLYDVNRTPTVTANPRRHTETIDVLSEGMRAMLGPSFGPSSGSKARRTGVAAPQSNTRCSTKLTTP
jgi:hypothetical protein